MSQDCRIFKKKAGGKTNTRKPIFFPFKRTAIFDEKITRRHDEWRWQTGFFLRVSRTISIYSVAINRWPNRPASSNVINQLEVNKFTILIRSSITSSNSAFEYCTTEVLDYRIYTYTYYIIYFFNCYEDEFFIIYKTILVRLVNNLTVDFWLYSSFFSKQFFIFM